ncbi:ABC transporter G family member 7-like [Cotesia glomerata]|uniref:ABC transporter G family member 7-like n=1 Tax=Cotesia glomerata TaxID=32391 RepID=UPI001D024654|nr:ABC transporter G family member 7-like [Cotesia glomerata]
MACLHNIPERGLIGNFTLYKKRLRVKVDVNDENNNYSNSDNNNEENIDINYNNNNDSGTFDVGEFGNDNVDYSCTVETDNVVNHEISSQTSKLSQKSLESNTSRLISDYEDEIPKQQVPKIDLMTSELGAALDRADVSSRSATYIFAALLSSLNIDCASVNFSHLTIHRAREKFRKEATLNLKTNLETDTYVLHFDGKLLSDITGIEQVNRLPIILSSSGKFQLLGIPKLESGTGQNQASAIITTVKQWNINTDNIKALCSDTTASNTGIRNGACVLVEKALNRQLLYLPCRHHIFEIVLRSAFEIYWPASSGPNVPIYQRFKKKWD